MTLPLTSEPGAAILNADQKRGRMILFIIFGIVLVIYGYFMVERAFARGFDAGDYQEAGRILLFTLLFYFVWIGQRWAKRLTVVLLFLVSFLVFPVVFRHFHPLTLGAFLVPTVVACVLAFSRSINSFLVFQRQRKKK